MKADGTCSVDAALRVIGIVERCVYPEVPPRVEYTLTKRGHSLAAILQQLAEWAESGDPYPFPNLTLARAPGICASFKDDARRTAVRSLPRHRQSSASRSRKERRTPPLL